VVDGLGLGTRQGSGCQGGNLGGGGVWGLDKRSGEVQICPLEELQAGLWDRWGGSEGEKKKRNRGTSKSRKKASSRSGPGSCRDASNRGIQRDSKKNTGGARVNQLSSTASSKSREEKSVNSPRSARRRRQRRLISGRNRDLSSAGGKLPSSQP